METHNKLFAKDVFHEGDGGGDIGDIDIVSGWGVCKFGVEVIEGVDNLLVVGVGGLDAEIVKSGDVVKDGVTVVEGDGLFFPYF